MKALIIAEHAAAAAELVAGARTMADEVVAISFGGAYECGADKVLNITVPEGLTVDSAVETVNAAFDAENPEVVLVEACRHMKVIAGSLAFHADTAVITDVTAFEAGGAKSMYFGGIAGLTSTFMYENVYCANAGVEPNAALCVIMCLVASFLASALGGLIYSFLTISLRTNQNVTGLTLTILGSGVGNFFGGSLNKLAGGVGQVSVAVTSQAFRNYSLSLVNFFDGFTGKLRLGTLLFSYGFLTYVAIILAVAIWFFLSKTRTGLSLRAIGENTATADAAGINVTKYKYLATCIGAGISGLGGTYYVMNYIKGTWENQGTIEALGWLAVALVIFATWKSLRAIWGSYLFGVLYWAYNYIPGLSRSTLELFKMLPYVVTILVLLMVSMRKKKEDQPPQSLGIPYFREER